jgi:5-methylcytosine-specific restriction endonuclease McrA
MAQVKADPERHEALKKYQREHAAAQLAKDPERVKARQKAWKARNPERMKFHYANKQRRRAAARKLKFSVDQLRQRLAYWGFRCWMCRAPYEAIDHVKPIARGGWHALMNLRPICGTCNSSKGYKWPFPVATR